jgi:diacylglycerol kinase family enzyme
VVGLHDLERFEVIAAHALPYQVDGDYVGEADHFTFESAPNALRLFA